LIASGLRPGAASAFFANTSISPIALLKNLPE